MEKIYQMIKVLPEKSEVWFCISLLFHKLDNERVFPAIYKAYSDYRKFYNVDSIGFPVLKDSWNFVKIVSHGLLHIDHRLLNYEAQEMSILVSSSLLKTRKFVPPFNKYNMVFT